MDESVGRKKDSNQGKVRGEKASRINGIYDPQNFGSLPSLMEGKLGYMLEYLRIHTYRKL
ncbi:hypothetical protein A3B21_05220 [Candidatus Uhrbacteria bacterium RIFCSPLOWO2_01_FULL_47_24]|uniref:Uncharacterized protein n=1 Tax=Candidatus Uhrbacteria bacterium RIFCSPLOWO2_01_FULL_47_24 TaxID=1802401 RepID=A0A1F7UWH3_9BACT|nr:MAG: hypothetical protein A2753_03255 [Candidatus Uhrbacteria bacterium RIFCSPHIGHO2_01_FULL_47_11]OGL75867.1 MAG: hypothetical protein A3F52_03480 [Candidatus Uhrbacteria bacterium RIFCSPHIGHO2_12_FULL_47_11]OGL82084.1 MAG: hypothetical protein A3B21_05220 [Candidatus Uhrbacteria bacterium RIFCSPLOWO2_01_FULL_47_24]OGL85479.1 MAG: hypothetical protein A3J03_05390 [Candidatus Uhrbacteria bacterium RIFCSPLOWO2_02_FULL_46_25]OGL92627.1 MAG: hypothetical protein A3H11_04145 [Candidatus Uhrbacte